MKMQPTTKPIVALTADLMFAARLRGTAQTIGQNVTLVRTGKELLDKARELSPREIIIDLDTRSLDPVALITTLKQDPALAGIPILAYVSHVREDAIEGARKAGADRVMARGAFVRNLPALLAGD
jgi:CheY-like chemotaxis protein